MDSNLACKRCGTVAVVRSYAEYKCIACGHEAGTVAVRELPPVRQEYAPLSPYITVAERAARIVDLWNEGLTLEEIAQREGIGTRYVYQHLKRAQGS